MGWFVQRLGVVEGGAFFNGEKSGSKSNGCQGWMPGMDARDGCQGWMPGMDT